MDFGLDINNDLLRDFNLADWHYEIILKSIKDFESTLDSDHEVALKLTYFGHDIMFNVTEIGYSNPSIIHYYGYINGNYAELIQHVSQINFLLTSVTKDNPNRKPHRIGFNPNSQT